MIPSDQSFSLRKDQAPSAFSKSFTDFPVAWQFRFPAAICRPRLRTCRPSLLFYSFAPVPRSLILAARDRSILTTTIMPPRDIPGFYWDPQKNRYFPLRLTSSTSAPSPLHPKISSPHQGPQLPNSPKAPVITSAYRRINCVSRTLPTLSHLFQRHQ